MSTRAKGEQLLDILKEVRKEKEDQAADGAEKTKVCTLCTRELPATEAYFYKEKRVKSGLSSWCRDCHREKQKVRDLKKSLAKRVGSVSLDFDAYPEMYVKLEVDARNDFRAVDQHILWIINDYFNRMPV
jgi:hypothetical protein